MLTQFLFIVILSFEHDVTCSFSFVQFISFAIRDQVIAFSLLCKHCMVAERWLIDLI